MIIGLIRTISKQRPQGLPHLVEVRGVPSQGQDVLSFGLAQLGCLQEAIPPELVLKEARSLAGRRRGCCRPHHLGLVILEGHILSD